MEDSYNIFLPKIECLHEIVSKWIEFWEKQKMQLEFCCGFMIPFYLFNFTNWNLIQQFIEMKWNFNPYLLYRRMYGLICIDDELVNWIIGWRWRVWKVIEKDQDIFFWKKIRILACSKWLCRVDKRYFTESNLRQWIFLHIWFKPIYCLDLCQFHYHIEFY